MNLEGKTVLLLGASRGLGLALARRLAREPVRLICGVGAAGRLPDLGDADVVAEVQETVLDLGSRRDIARSLDLIGAELDDVDVLVNDAGHVAGGHFEDKLLDEVYDCLQIDLAAVMHVTHALLPHLLARPEAKIVNHGSLLADVRLPGVVVCSACKAAIAAFSDGLRRELADSSVSVLHLAAGGADGDLLRVAEDHTRSERQAPAQWADRVLRAIAEDATTLHADEHADALAHVAADRPQELYELVSIDGARLRSLE